MPEISTQVGVVYIFLPNRYYNSNEVQHTKNGTVFQLHHFYSLLLLAKTLKSNPNNKLLFYYLNDSGKPISNHYNRWIDDPDWIGKIGLTSIKFIKIDYNSTDFNLYDLMTRIKFDSLKHFDDLDSKQHLVLSTSDVLIGPRIMSCFSKDLFVNDYESSLINTHTVRAKMTSECYDSIHTNNHFSFLYRIESIHRANDFSGLFIEKIKNMTHGSQFKHDLIDKHVTSFNNYKCHYKRDIINAEMNSLNSYENSFCVFGFEMNAYDIPKLEDVFFKQSYMNSMIRKFIFNSSDLITYKRIERLSQIPNIVHLIWFADGPRPLKFIEYLCLKSILLVLKPDKIRIHGDIKPIGDHWNEIIEQSKGKIEWVVKEKNFYKVFKKT